MNFSINSYVFSLTFDFFTDHLVFASPLNVNRNTNRAFAREMKVGLLLTYAFWINF